MTLHSRSARMLGALALLALTAAACGGDDSDAASTTTAASPTTESSTTETTADGAGTALAGEALVDVAESALGQILTSDGKTLYTFMPDNAGAPTCNGDCATSWPPLLADGDVPVGDGLDGALFATVARDDGGTQVTVNGWPLYFFAGDTAAGETNGQGVGGKWYVVGPDGTAIDDD